MLETFGAKAKSAYDADKLGNLFFRPNGGFPIIDAFSGADRCLAGIKKVSGPKIEIDIRDCLTHTGTHGDLGRWLGRQFDARNCNTGVKVGE